MAASKPIVLVTGAGGKTGKLVAQKVKQSDDYTLRALFRTDQVQTCFPHRSLSDLALRHCKRCHFSDARLFCCLEQASSLACFNLCNVLVFTLKAHGSIGLHKLQYSSKIVYTIAQGQARFANEIWTDQVCFARTSAAGRLCPCAHHLPCNLQRRLHHACDNSHADIGVMICFCRAKCCHAHCARASHQLPRCCTPAGDSQWPSHNPCL